MKKLWKALGIAAIAAAVVPVKFEKDETTGKKKYQSLLLSVDVESNAADEKFDIDVNIGKGILNGIIASAVTKKEDVLFADDEPEAAVVDTPLTEIVGEAVETAVEEVIAGAEDAETVEPTEEDFDPDL